MRFFLDTEFTTDVPEEVELISIGVVGEDGSEFYAVSNEFETDRCGPWVTENVLPLLEPRDDPVWRTRAQIRDDLVAFLGDRATEMWGYSPGYDWWVVHSLFGRWGNLPEAFPWNCWDLKQWAWHLGVVDSLPSQTELPVHHALADARHDRMVHGFLADVAARAG